MAEGGDLDSWEDQADSGLFDKRLDEMSVEIQQSSEKMKAATKGPVMLSEESSSTQYQPKVRILKRDTKTPSAQANVNKSSSQASASKANKSLQQREAEYAEARMRIFGCMSPEDEEGGDTNSNGDQEGDKNNSSVMIQGVPQIFKSTGNTVPVIRQPRGPDGTTGFNKPDHS